MELGRERREHDETRRRLCQPDELRERPVEIVDLSSTSRHQTMLPDPSTDRFDFHEAPACQ
jgi:hypothetical protein